MPAKTTTGTNGIKSLMISYYSLLFGVQAILVTPPVGTTTSQRLERDEVLPGCVEVIGTSGIPCATEAGQIQTHYAEKHK